MLCVVGMPGSGKSEFVEIGKRHGFSVVVMGDAVREETLRRGLPLEMHGNVAKNLREEFGDAAVASSVLPYIKEEKKTIIDGVRGWSEIEEFRKHYDAVIVGLVCGAQKRFSRLKARGREGDPQSWHEFERRDLRELGFGLGNVLALADCYIENEGTLEEFRKACEGFFERGMT